MHSLAVDEYKEWYSDVFEYLANGYLPSNHHKARNIRRKASPFYLDGEVLYKRAADGVLLRCLTRKESLDAMREAHEGSCGEHQGGRRLHILLLRVGYFWLTMYKDCVKFARSCPECQIRANVHHTPAENLHPVGVYWPFQVWGLDFVGPINLNSSKGHKFNLLL